MINTTAVFILILFVSLPGRATPDRKIVQGKKLVIGDVVELQSKTLGETRKLWIYLPDKYSGSHRRYPVLYLLDGENNFHHVSGIVQFLSRLSHMPPMIVVAVINVDRYRDFLPTGVNGWPPVAQADKFLGFLGNELIPFIDEHYRTIPNFRILCGHSYGGIFCLNALFSNPGLFKTYIAVSPSLSYDNQFFLKKAEPFFKAHATLKKFLYITVSGADKDDIKSCRKFSEILKTYSPKDLEWNFQYMEKENHGSIVHPTVYNAMEWLFRGWRIHHGKWPRMTLKQIQAHYKKLSGKFGFDVRIPELIFTNKGYQLLDNKKFDEAAEVFKAEIESIPGTIEGYLGMSDVYLDQGDLETTMKYYLKAMKQAEKYDREWIPIVQSLMVSVQKKIDKKQNKPAGDKK